MLLPNRHGSSDKYRYGFNGKEKDDELKGSGNSYDFGARMYDSRLGRWFAPDAFEKKYPSNSTYSYALNSPLSVIDPDGNDIVIIGNKEYRRQVQQTIRDLYNSSPSGRKVLMDLMDSEKVFVIVENKSEGNQYKGFGSSKAEGYVIFNYDENDVYTPANGLGDMSLDAPPITTLAHELGHAHDDLTGATDDIKFQKVVDRKNPLIKNPKFGEWNQPKYFRNSIKATEVGNVEFENQVRAELGLTLRTHYGGQNIFEKKLSEKIYEFGTNYYNTYKTPILLHKTFDFSKYNVEEALRSNIEEVFNANKWWDVIFESKLESNVNFGFEGSSTAYPKSDGDDKALRLTTKKKDN